MGTSPDRLPREMREFVAWLNAAESSVAPGRIEELAAEAFIRFIEIHPFDDGNGRTWRALINIILARRGRPTFEPALISNSGQVTGYVALLPGDAEFLAFLIRDAQQGRSTLKYSRYGIPREEREIPQSLVDAKEVSPTDFLSWIRRYIGWAFPSIQVLREVLGKTNLNAEQYREFILILKAGLQKNHSEETRREISDAIEYFSIRPLAK